MTSQFKPATLLFTLGLLVASLTAQPVAAQSVTLKPLATFPHGSYLENMLADDDGSVFVTNYFAKRIERWAPKGGSNTFKQLDLYAVSLANFGKKLLVVAHSTTFDKIAGDPDANRLLILSQQGAIDSTWTVKGAGFLNGIEPIGGSQFLIADSMAGLIWIVDAKNRTSEPWLKHELLLKLPGSTGPNPGANGVHLSKDGWVYISNSERKALYRVRMGKNGKPSGSLKTVKEGFPGIDDFALVGDGSIIIATHQHEIIRLAGDGQLSTLTSDERVAGATSVVAGRGASAGYYFVTGTGGLFEGGKGDAALLKFRLR